MAVFQHGLGQRWRVGEFVDPCGGAGLRSASDAVAAIEHGIVRGKFE